MRNELTEASKQIHQMKNKLEDSIQKLIIKFEAETGTIVTEINAASYGVVDRAKSSQIRLNLTLNSIA